MQSFDITKSIVIPPVVDVNGGYVLLNTSFIIVSSILRESIYTDDEIKENLMALKETRQNLFITYILLYVFYAKKYYRGNECTIHINDDDKKAHYDMLALNVETGIASIPASRMRQRKKCGK